MTKGDKKRQRQIACFLGDFQHLRLSKLVTACQALSAKKFVRDVGVGGSNPLTPTIHSQAVLISSASSSTRLVRTAVFFGTTSLPRCWMVAMVRHVPKKRMSDE
jgi:uncharacterized membrane protein (GlpM family)